MHSFVDQNDENSLLEAPHTVNALDVCNYMTPTTQNNLADCQMVPTKVDSMLNDCILPNVSSTLSMSQMMLTSYITLENPKASQVATTKRESTVYSISEPLQTPKSIIDSSSSGAFQQIVQNENSPKRSISFAIVRSPTTPIPGGRTNKSMHLIDLTTPEWSHTPNIEGSSTSGSKCCGRNLLKSAIKNAALTSTIKKVDTSNTIETFPVRKCDKLMTKASTIRHMSNATRSNVITSTPMSFSNAIYKNAKSNSLEEINVPDNSTGLIAMGNFFIYYTFEMKRKKNKTKNG